MVHQGIFLLFSWCISKLRMNFPSIALSTLQEFRHKIQNKGIKILNPLYYFKFSLNITDNTEICWRNPKCMNGNGNFLISILSERLSILAKLGTKLFMTQMFKAKTFKLNFKLILNLISMLFKITSESKYLSSIYEYTSNSAVLFLDILSTYLMM